MIILYSIDQMMFEILYCDSFMIHANNSRQLKSVFNEFMKFCKIRYKYNILCYIKDWWIILNNLIILILYSKQIMIAIFIKLKFKEFQSRRYNSNLLTIVINIIQILVCLLNTFNRYYQISMGR